MFSQKFAVYFYVNGENTATLENVTAEVAYDESVPPCAFRNDSGNRWHVMLRNAAIPHMKSLEINTSVSIAWEDPHPTCPNADVEKIVVKRIG